MLIAYSMYCFCIFGEQSFPIYEQVCVFIMYLLNTCMVFPTCQVCNCVLILVTQKVGAGFLVGSLAQGPSHRLRAQETWFPSSRVQFLSSLDL